MFGKVDVVELIQNGELEKLKKAVAKKPEILTKIYEWRNDAQDMVYWAHAIGIAAYYNQPDMVRFLAEQGMSVNKTPPDEWAPLHYAAANASSATVAVLLEIGADPLLKNNDGQIPVDICRDSAARDMLLEAVSAARQEKTQAETAAKTAGEWTATSADEVVFARELPGGQYHLTQVFNFATGALLSITKDLETGQAVPETKAFTDLTEEMVTAARIMLHKLTGVTTPMPAPDAATEKRDINPANYERFTKLGK